MLNIDSSILTLVYILISIAFLYSFFRLFIPRNSLKNTHKDVGRIGSNPIPLNGAGNTYMSGSMSQMFNYSQIAAARSNNQRAKNQKRMRGNGKK